MFAPAHPRVYLDRSALDEIDGDLARLARADGRLALQMGDTLERLCRINGLGTLGYASRAAYANQVLGQRARAIGDLCALARRLETLPLIRAALAAGAIGRSMATVLARFATPECEAELLARARRSTVREMKAQLAAAHGKDNDADEDDQDELRSTIETSVPITHEWAYKAIRRLMREGFGVYSADDMVEYMLAEGAIFLSMLDRDLVALGPPEHPAAKWVHEQRELERQLRDDAEAEAEDRIDLEAP